MSTPDWFTNKGLRTQAQLLVKEFVNGDHRRLAAIDRYSTQWVLRRENVAEHSFFVAANAYMIYLKLKELESDLDLDLGDLLARALNHDFDEVVSGDIPHQFKHADSALNKMINKVATQLLVDWAQRVGLPQRWVDSVRYAKASDLAGQIIRFSDMSAVVAYAAENIEMGNKRMRPAAQNAVDILQKYIDNGVIVHPFLMAMTVELKAVAARLVGSEQ
jgi:5'-deoxynucleotidase YfbR-like HD superfamily hydrolase